MTTLQSTQHDPEKVCEENEHMAVSPLRWYVMVCCAGIAATQGGYWGNFGPIAQAVKPFFGWNDASIALLNNWGPICYLIAAWPTIWLLDVKGLRWSCIVGSLLVFFGSVCRVVHVAGDPAGGYFMHIGQFINGLAGPVAMGVGPPMSATWFPANERTTATSVVAVTNYGGCAAMFVLGPMLVTVHNTKQNLWLYMFGELVFSIVLLIGCLFMPAKPPFPPSRSARMSRSMMVTGFLQLAKKRNFWAIAVSYGLVTGFFGAWGSMLGPNIQNVLPASVAETDAGWMGFWGAIAGIFGGVGLSIYADSGRMAGAKKGLLLVTCSIAAVFYFIFAGLCVRLFSFQGGSFTAALYASSIMAALFANASTPLFYEMAVESAYPIAEGLTTIVLTVLNNIACLVFLLVQNIPHVGTTWMNWAVCAACASPLVILVRVREQQLRLAVDTAVSPAASPIMTGQAQ